MGVSPRPCSAPAAIQTKTVSLIMFLAVRWEGVEKDMHGIESEGGWAGDRAVRRKKEFLVCT